jgi:hypothetical protein
MNSVNRHDRMPTQEIVLTITVPAYNVGRYVEQCLQSLARQTYHDIEIIVVNDGSTDNTGEICDNAARYDARFRIIHQENKGLVAARKTALGYARGRYVGCVDGDDYVEPTYCETLIDAALRDDADLVVAGHMRDYKGNKHAYYPKLQAGVYEGQRLSRLHQMYISAPPVFSHGISTYLWSKIYKTDLYAKYQLAVPDSFSMAEDAACIFPMIASSRKVSVTHACEYHYVQHQTSMLKRVAGSWEAEAKKVIEVCDHIRLQTVNHPLAASIHEQIREYERHQLIARTGGVDVTADGVTIFGKFVPKGSAVAVCNAGSLGQRVVQRIRELNGISIIGWFDQDWEKYQADGLPVQSEDRIATCSADYFIVAATAGDYKTNAIATLRAIDVPDRQIIVPS